MFTINFIGDGLALALNSLGWFTYIVSQEVFYFIFCLLKLIFTVSNEIVNLPLHLALERGRKEGQDRRLILNQPTIFF